MSTTITDEAVFGDQLIVDADVHCAHYEPETGAQVAEQMEWPYDILLDPNENYTMRTGPSTGHYGQLQGRLKSIDQAVADPSEDIDGPLLDDLGIDHPILNILGRFDMYSEKEMVPDWNRATNNMFLDHFLDANEDYFGLAPLQTRIPDKAAEEVDRIGEENQIVGVMIHAGGQWSGLGDPKFDQIWEAVEDNDLTVAFNGSFNGYMMQMPDIFRGMANKSEINALQYPWSMMWTLSSLIANGTPVKFPDLNFVCLDAGISWVPYTMARLNREYSTWRSQVPLLEEMPEHYIRDQFYFGTQPMDEFAHQADVASFIELIGADSLLFSTNHPFVDEEDLQILEETLGELSSEDRQKIFAENAIEAFGLPI